jgi:hypothetical protein
MRNKYRVPNNAKFLLILPELDARIEGSPTLQEIMERLDKNKIIPRKYIHAVFSSQYFGMIPFELINTYPMGQYESILPTIEEDFSFNKAIKNCMVYLNKNLRYYQKAGMLIPKVFINQFGENKLYPRNILNQELDLKLKNTLKSNYQICHSLDDMLQFFRID